MLLQKESDVGAVVIKGYRPGEISISGKIYRTPVLITASDLNTYDLCASLNELDIEQLIPLLPKDSEILLIGTGEKHLFMPIAATQRINAMGIALEVMATRPACHTFQVLAFDKRNVVALMFP